jgi:hypothetical protein
LLIFHNYIRRAVLLLAAVGVLHTPTWRKTKRRWKEIIMVEWQNKEDRQTERNHFLSSNSVIINSAFYAGIDDLLACSLSWAGRDRNTLQKFKKSLVSMSRRRHGILRGVRELQKVQCPCHVGDRTYCGGRTGK